MMSGYKIRVVQQVLDPSGSGGVSAEYRALQHSRLAQDYEFIPMILMTPHNGVNIRDIWFYYSFLRKVHPDIVHVRGAAPDGLNAIIAAKLVGNGRILVSVHGMYSDLVYINPIKKWISFHIIERLTYCLADGISCVCENAHNRKRFAQYREKMLPYVYNRMPDYSGFDRENIREQIRRKLKIEPEASVGVYVGRITKEKGLHYLKTALERISEDIVVLIIGEGQYLKEFKSTFRKNVYFLGNQKDIYRYLFAGDFFLQPSLHENHSIALLEAVAAGLPVIATDVGGNEEIVEDNITGFLIEPRNTDALVRAINKLVEEPEVRNNLQQNIKKRNYGQFQNDFVDNQLRRVYQALICKYD